MRKGLWGKLLRETEDFSCCPQPSEQQFTVLLLRCGLLLAGLLRVVCVAQVHANDAEPGDGSRLTCYERQRD